MQRALLLLGAAILSTVSIALLLVAGLPQRASFTGERTPGNRLIAPELSATAPDFVAHTPTGETIRLSDLRGQPVIINFWATWCGPCAVEMPILQSVFEAHQDNSLHILAVNMGEPASTVQRWQETQHLSYDLVLDETGAISALYRLRGQPSTYVIAPDGTITRIFFGPVDEAALSAALG